jgi:hypothetical protein
LAACRKSWTTTRRRTRRWRLSYRSSSRPARSWRPSWNAMWRRARSESASCRRRSSASASRRRSGRCVRRHSAAQRNAGAAPVASCIGVQSPELTSPADQVQAEQGRSQQRAEHPAEGDHYSARRPAHPAPEAPRRRGSERRLRAPDAQPDLVTRRH